MALTIRLAWLEDAPAFAEIYRPFVENTPVTFEEQAPSPDEMARRIETTLASFPWLALEIDGATVGYAYGSLHRARSSYRWAVDVTVYLAPEARGQGGGRALYERLLEILTLQRYTAAFAGITLPNMASVGLHQAMGFRPLGVYRNVGYKRGAWHDVGWWQRDLLARGNPPPEPIPFAQMSGFRVSATSRGLESETMAPRAELD